MSGATTEINVVDCEPVVQDVDIDAFGFVQKPVLPGSLYWFEKIRP